MRRSLSDPVDPAAAELFRAIADVVVEKVTEEGLRVVQEQIVKGLRKGGIDADFPATISILEKRLSLRDLQHIASTVRQALQLDLARYALGESEAAEGPQFTAFIAEAAAGNAGPESAFAVMAVALERTRRENGQRFVANKLEEMDAVIAILTEAANSNRLNAGYLSRASANPPAYVVGVKVPKLSAPLQRALLRGAEVLSDPNLADQERLVRALEFAVGLHYVDGNSTASASIKNGGSFGESSRSEIVRAALEGQLGLAVDWYAARAKLWTDRGTSGKHPFTEEHRAYSQRALRTLALIATIVDTPRLPADASEAERQALLDARKQAVGRLIDSNVAAGSREGWLVSLGANLNANLGQRLDKYLYSNVRNQPLSLSLGAALDYRYVSGWGVHVEASPLDVLGFATFKGKTFRETAEIEWSDVITPTFRVGLSFAATESNIIWNLCTFIADRPEPVDDHVYRSRDLILGLSIGAYVPILDLN